MPLLPKMDSELHLPFNQEEHDIIDLGCFSDSMRYQYHYVDPDIEKRFSAMESQFIKRGTLEIPHLSIRHNGRKIANNFMGRQRLVHCASPCDTMRSRDG
jgi:hypothetical protein